jgi:hypothetical protein
MQPSGEKNLISAHSARVHSFAAELEAPDANANALIDALNFEEVAVKEYALANLKFW